jgi:hypothetical protein
MAFVASLRRSPRFNSSDPATLGRQPHILLPSRRRQSRFHMNAGQGLIPS